MKIYALAGIAALTLISGQAFADDVQFTLTNNSSYTIDQFYASPASKDDWGDDILGKDRLEGGQVATVTVTNGSEACEFDLKVVDEEKQEHELNGINICEVHEVTFDK